MRPGSRDCAVVRGQLPLFPGRELSREVDRQLRDHLAGCRACQRELRAWLDVRGAFDRATGAEQPPAGGAAPDDRELLRMQDEVLARISAEPGAAIRRRSHAVRALVAAALFVVGVGMVSRFGGQDRRPKLLDLDRFVDSSAPARDASSSTRPVSLSTWTGLRGRERADALLWGSAGDVGVQTLLVPLRQGGEDGERLGGQPAGATPAGGR